MIQLSDEVTRRVADAEVRFWEKRAKRDSGDTQCVEELATEFLHLVFFTYVSEYFKTDAGPAEIRISAESTLTSLVNELIPSPKWPLPQHESARDEMMTVTASSRSTWTPAPAARVLDRNEIVEAKRAQALGSIMQSAEWREFQARLREWKQVKIPNRKKRGPRPDDEGHKRVAELLPDNWEGDLEGALKKLAEPADGGPPVSPSRAWQKEYGISSYAEAWDEIGIREIKQHLERRRKIGIGIAMNNSQKLSETVRNRRTSSATVGLTTKPKTNQ